MIELKDHKVHDLLTRTVTVHPSVPPVVQVRYTQNQTMFADEVRLVFKKDNDGPWKLYDVVVNGFRQLASGAHGIEPKKNSYPRYDADKRPDWLVEIIGFFTPED